MTDYTLYLISPEHLTPVLGLHVEGSAQAVGVVTIRYDLKVKHNGWAHNKWGVLLNNADATYLLVHEKCTWAFSYVTQEVTA
jgi:hypothetical protein